MTKILLVEDDKSLREIYGVRLLAEGYDIVSAGDGEEALAMAIKERPALIVSDVMMPKISGFDMLDILRSTTETKDIKVIMMTALSSEDQRQRGEALGADRYLVKSQVGIEDVVRAVHEVLGDLPGLASSGAPSQPATSAPAPAIPAPTQPITAQPVTLQPLSDPEPANSPLPQPTAPFASTIPRPTNLGERVIQPTNENPTDISTLMSRELGDESTTSNEPTDPNLPNTNATDNTPNQPQEAPDSTATGSVPRPDITALSPAPPVNSQPPQPSGMPQQPPTLS